MNRKEARISKNPVKRKQPKFEPRTKEKIPIIRDRPNLDLTIGWNFNRMDRHGKFRCSLNLLEQFVDQLIALEQIKIGDLLNRNHNHPMGVEKLSREAKARLDALHFDEETLYQLALNTSARLWGVLEGNIFYIVWLDPEHEVYPCR